MSANNGLFYRYSDHLGSTSVLGKAGASSPQSDSIARYFPFGDWRSEPAQTVTSLGYTGHRHDNLATNDLGLIYMNARYYLPGLGRFASPDTLVPDPANPQAFNRYTYTYNNPLKHKDPDGHCPAPILENGYDGGGNIICIAGFIPTAYSEGPGAFGFVLIYEGDGRWFSSDSGLTDSRFWAWIDTSTGEIVGNYVHPTVSTNEPLPALAELLGGECDGNRCTYAQPEWTAHFASSKVEGTDIIIFGYSMLCSHPSCYFGPGPDGLIAFLPDGQGTYNAAGVTESFPNLEAYYWEDEMLKDTVFRIDNFSQSDLSTDVGSFETAKGMYSQFSYWDTIPWWQSRGSVGH